MTLGERIKKRRLELKLRRDDVAAVTRISYAQLARYEADENMPTAEIAVRLSNALQISADWLLGNTQIHGIEGLSPLEQEVVQLLRTKTPETQQTILDLLKVVDRL